MKTINYLKAALFFSAITLQCNCLLAQYANNNGRITRASYTDRSYYYNNNTEKDFTNEVGIRAGETSGITYKHFINSTNAAEVIFGMWPYAFRFTALYEHYVPTNTTGLRWYYGAGGHLTAGYGRGTYYPYYRDTRYYMYRYNYPGLGIGIDGIIGAEYKIPKIPFALSLDIKPLIEINNSPQIFMAFDPGFGVKFTF